MNVPKLRFGGFEESWEQYQFSDAVSITDCKHRTPEYINSGIPVVSPGLIRWGALDLSESSKQVSEKEAISLMDHCIVKQKDLIFSRNQSVGIASQVKTDERFVLGQDVVLLQEKKLSIDYVYFCIQTPKVQNLIKRASGGSTFSRINLGELRKLNLYCGKSDEQQKIASFLSKVDKKIRLLTEKKDKLIEYKKSVMQQLFNGRFEKNSEGDKTTFISPILRFKADDGSDFPDWEDSQIGSYTEQLNGYAFKSDEIGEIHEGYQLMRGINITEGRIRHSVEMDRYYSGDISKITKYLIKEDDLVIGMDGSKVGKNVSLITKRDSNSLLVQRVARLRSKPRTSIQYIYQNIIAEKFRRYVDVVNTSSGIPHISKKQIEDYRIGFPCFEEQVKIANFLSSIDQKISLANSELEKFKQWKKGLLQQMFV